MILSSRSVNVINNNQRLSVIYQFSDSKTIVKYIIEYKKVDITATKQIFIFPESDVVHRIQSTQDISQKEVESNLMFTCIL